MVKNAINFLAIISIGLFSSYNHQDENPNLDKFVKEIFKYYKLPGSIVKDCKWNYAIMVLKTNSDNRITDVDFANDDISDDLRNSFQFLEGYQFSDTLKRYNSSWPVKVAETNMNPLTSVILSEVEGDSAGYFIYNPEAALRLRSE